MYAEKALSSVFCMQSSKVTLIEITIDHAGPGLVGTRARRPIKTQFREMEIREQANCLWCVYY